MSKSKRKGWRLVRSAALAVMFSSGASLPLTQASDGARLGNRGGDEPPRHAQGPHSRRPEA